MNAFRSSDSSPVHDFGAPITTTFHYTDADLRGVDPTTMRLYYASGAEWAPLSAWVVDTSAYTAACSTLYLSTFRALGGASMGNRAYLPIVRKGYQPANASRPDGFVGSTAISTTQPVVAIVNETDHARAGDSSTACDAR